MIRGFLLPARFQLPKLNARTSLGGFFLVFAVLLGLAGTTPLRAAHPFGALIPVPNVLIPGTPVAELNLNGEAFLLLRKELPLGPLVGKLWNPNNTIILDLPANVTVNALEGVTGMQTVLGPRVFYWGDFELSGTPTRLIEWDGTDWGLPGGPVTGITPSDVEVRQTGGGPELWVGGSLSILPGVPGTTPIGIYNGVTWQTPANFVGSVDEIVIVAESATDQTVVLSGALTSVGALPLSGVARFNGTWDDLEGGYVGEISAMNAFLDEANELEVWVTGVPNGSLYPVSRYASGNWEEYPVLVSSTPTGGLGRFRRLPTVFGDGRIADSAGSLGMFPGSELTNLTSASVVWNPTTGLYRPGGAPARDVIQFESPSGLYPVGNYRSYPSGELLEWVVEEIEFLRGDANGDGSINVADAMFTIRFLFVDGPEPDCRNAADWTGNTTLDLGDAIGTLQFLFNMGSAPPPPFPNCGFEPSVVVYDCATPPNCP